MQDNKLLQITASEITVIVRDAVSGIEYKRTLPVDYTETANCLRLKAEDANGKPAEIVFFTETGLGHINDLCGGGPDKDPCGGHSH